MDTVLRGLDFVLQHVDNILDSSPSEEEHLQDLRAFQCVYWIMGRALIQENAEVEILKKMNSAERNYSAFDHDFLASCLVVRHFLYLIQGQVFHVNTDRKPLTFALKSSSVQRSPWQAQHLAFIHEFTSDLCHIKEDVKPSC